MKIGDLVETKAIHGHVHRGIVVEVYKVPGGTRMRAVSVLKDDGNIGKWYASHVKVVQ